MTSRDGEIIRDTNIKKSCQTSDIPTKVIILSSNIFSNSIYKHFNCYIDKSEFPNELEHADIVQTQNKV